MTRSAAETTGIAVTQPAASDLPERVWDVVVVGGGPAGSTAAAHLARSGRAVLILDRQRFPREKVCGDGLIADAIGALDRLHALDAVRERALRVTITSIYSPSRVRVDIAGEFLTLKRLELDALIARQAVRYGAMFARGRVVDVHPGADGVGVVVDGRERPVLSRFVVLATGADVTLHSRLHAKAERPPSAIALRCYVRSAETVDRLVISYDRQILPGYAWIFPLPGGEYNVGCGVFRGNRGPANVNLRSTFDCFVGAFPEARAILARATSRTALKGARLRCGLTEAPAAVCGRVVTIGESIGATFPFTGEGIGKAMQTGELAAETIDAALEDGSPDALLSFSGRVARTLGPRYVGYRAAERWLSYPWLNDLLARRVRRSRYLQKAAAGVLNETVDPRAIFSVRGLARSLLR